MNVESSIKQIMDTIVNAAIFSVIAAVIITWLRSVSIQQDMKPRLQAIDARHDPLAAENAALSSTNIFQLDILLGFSVLALLAARTSVLERHTAYLSAHGYMGSLTRDELSSGGGGDVSFSVWGGCSGCGGNAGAGCGGGGGGCGGGGCGGGGCGGGGCGGGGCGGGG